MHILLGITGGIAAYKSCILLREFQKAGHLVKVIMTDASQNFIGEKTFESLTEDQVYTSDWLKRTQGNAHIHLARWADIFIIAPATANSLYACAHGKADDLLGTVFLAFDKPVFFAPAMNTKMLEQPAVIQNMNTLKTRGHIMLDPQSGELACKEVGPGKMMEPEDIFRLVLQTHFSPSKLLNLKIVITAGPTREYIDPVRFISSPSTGAMGFCIAQACLKRGAQVILIHGPTQLNYSGESISVVSAQEMFEAVKKNTPCHIFIGAAAVADYAPLNQSKSKAKKSKQDFNLTLTRTRDIISHVASNKLAKKLTVGFAAQTERVVEHATEKRKAKKMDIIVGNHVFESQKGFGDTPNTFHIITKNSHDIYENMSKNIFAQELCNTLESCL